jgi:hypothetical protein
MGARIEQASLGSRYNHLEMSTIVPDLSLKKDRWLTRYNKKNLEAVMMKQFMVSAIVICSLIVPTGVIAAMGFSERLLLGELQPDSSAYTVAPRVCTGINNEIYVVWLDEVEQGEDRILFTKSLDGGSSFEEKRVIDSLIEDEMDFSRPEIGVGRNGSICILYLKYDRDNDEVSLLMRKSEDAGDSFDGQTVYTKSIGFLQTINYGTDIKVTDTGIHFVWSDTTQIFYASSQDCGENFEVLKVESDNDGSVRSKIWPSLAIDSNDNAYAIWYAAELDADKIIPLYDLYFAKLKNGQQAFTESKIIAKCDADKGTLKQPSIITSTTDEVFVFWNDASNGSQDSLSPQQLFRISSRDGGETFSESLKITFGEAAAVQNHGVIIDQKDGIHLLYLLGSNGRLYYSKTSDLGDNFNESVEVDRTHFGADICLSKNEESIYVVLNDEHQDGNHGVYFTKSVEVSQANRTENPSTSSGGSGNCFILSLGN